MALPSWTEVRQSMAEAIRTALPLQARKAEGQRIAGVGLHIDGYYGSAGPYLLPEAAARSLGPDAVDSIGDWPVSTDWDLSEDHAGAFAASWGRWDDWFHVDLDDLGAAEHDEKFRGLLRVACEAMRQLEAEGLLEGLAKTEDFKIIIAEHDEPDRFAVERYNLFVETGVVRVYGEPV